MQLNDQGFIPAVPKSRLAVGCDLGQRVDPCAIVTVERLEMPIPVEEGGVGSDLVQRLGEPRYIVRNVKVLPLGTPYEQVILTLRDLRNRLGQSLPIIVDVSGNRAFQDLCIKRGDLPIIGLGITPGGFEAVTYDRATGEARISKAALVGELASVLTADELVLPDDVPGVELLQQELGSFQLSRSPVSGAPIWGGFHSHDDVLMATAYALHYLRPRRGSRVSSQPLHL